MLVMNPAQRPDIDKVGGGSGGGVGGGKRRRGVDALTFPVL
jgi:hypothetical protein